MVTPKVLYFSLASSVAVALASIIYIIVDKTSEFLPTFYFLSISEERVRF